MSSSLRAWLDSLVGARVAAVMGVINVTPDSFFDGGRFADPQAARDRVDALLADGADLIDVGGESSRPGSQPVPPGEQLRRIEPALRHAVSQGARVSVDTTHPEVAERALSLGAVLVNDVSCLANPALARVAARHSAGLLIMHCRGKMVEMKGFSDWPDAAYRDVVAEVGVELCAARDQAIAQGVPREQILFDPGLGFAKNARHSLELLGLLGELREAGQPLVVGPGRKSFIAAVDPSTPAERLGGTIAACLLAAERGAAMLRVHDVREVRQALAVERAVRRPQARP